MEKAGATGSHGQDAGEVRSTKVSMQTVTSYSSDVTYENLVQETPKGTVSSVQASVTIDLSRSPDLSEGSDHHDVYPSSNSSTHPAASHGAKRFENEVTDKCNQYENMFDNWNFEGGAERIACLNYLNEAAVYLANFVVLPNELVTKISEKCRLKVLNTINFMFRTGHIYPRQGRKSRHRSIVEMYVLAEEIQDSDILNLGTQFLGNIAILMSMYIFLILEYCKKSDFESIVEESEDVRNEVQLVYAGFIEMAKCFFDTTHKMYDEIELQNGSKFTVYDHLIDSFAGNTSISEQNLNGFQNLIQVIVTCHRFYGTIVNLEFCKVLLLASEYRNGKAALCSSSYQLSYVKPSISSLSNQICDYFLEMNEDELKQEDVLYVEQILYVVGIIHTRVFQEQDFSSFIQKHVQVGAKLLRCSMLEKRLCAMNYISRLCNTVDIHNNNMDNRATLASTADDYRYTNGKDVVGVRWHYFDSKNMLDCLEQYQILDTVYTKVFHAELIKKSVDIIVFYSRLDCVTEEHIELIWKSLRDKNENERRIIFDCLISALMNSRNLLHCRNTIYLIEKLILSSVAKVSEDKPFLLFLRQFFSKVCKLSKEKREAIEKSSNVVNSSDGIHETPRVQQSNTVMPDKTINGWVINLTGDDEIHNDAFGRDNNTHAEENGNDSRIQNPCCSLSYIDACFEAFGEMNFQFVCQNFSADAGRSGDSGGALQEYANNVLIALVQNNIIFSREYLNNLTCRVIASLKIYKIKPSKGLILYRALFDNHVQVESIRCKDEERANEVNHFHSVLLTMEAKDDIVNVLLEGIQHYCRTGKTSQEEVEAYCDLLTYLLRYSEYKINEGHIAKLWDDTAPKYTPMWVTYLFIYSIEADLFFVNQDQQGNIYHIIFKQICSIEIKHFTARAFAAYKSYFYLINKEKLNMTVTRTAKSEDLPKPSAIFDATIIGTSNLLGIDFDGLEKAWELVKFSADPGLNYLAKAFLIDLYETDSNVDGITLLETRKKLIADAFLHLNALLNVNSNSSVPQEHKIYQDQIYVYTGVTNLIDLLMLLVEKHEFSNGNKKFSHRTGVHKTKKKISVGYAIQLDNKSFSFDLSVIPQIEVYNYESIGTIHARIMDNIITKGIIKDCFDRLSKEEDITIATWNESDFVLQYHKRTISPIDSQSECSKNIAEEYKFYTNNGHFAKDQLNMVYVHPKGEALSVDGLDSAIGVNQRDNSHVMPKNSSVAISSAAALQNVEASKVVKATIKSCETSYILSTSPFFDQLLDTLNHSYTTIVTKVWNLLQRVCTSQKLLRHYYERVHKIEIKCFAFSPTATVGMHAQSLYALQIVWKLIFTPRAMPAFPSVYLRNEAEVDSDKIRTWKNAFLNGSGLLAVENIIKGHVPTPCNARTIQNNLYSLNLLRLALDIVQYFINIPLACAPGKKFPLPSDTNKIDMSNGFYAIDHLLEISVIIINVLHSYGTKPTSEQKPYRTVLQSAVDLLSSTFQLVQQKQNQDIGGKSEGKLIYRFFTNEVFLKLLYVIRDCDNVSIRSKIALFISHEVLVLDSGRGNGFEITIDTIYHYLNLAYTLISTVDYKSDNVYEYFAVLRNLCGNFNHCQVAEINDKFKGVLKHFIGVQEMFSNLFESTPTSTISEKYIMGVLTVLRNHLTLLHKFSDILINLSSFDWKSSLCSLKAIMVDRIIFNFNETALGLSHAKPVAFKVLQALWRLNLNPKTNFSKISIQKKLLELHDSKHVPQSHWSFSIDEEKRDEGIGYIGLYNQGSTCYMNSLLQQFFMITSFREAILDCDLLTVEDIQLRNEYNKTQGKSSIRYGTQLAEFLYELKKTFAFLKYSSLKAYNPISFVNACRNKPDGFFMMDSDVFDQNDAGEFLSLFLDKVETSLKYAGTAKQITLDSNTPRLDENAIDTDAISKEGTWNLVKHSFVGEYAHQMIILDDNNRLKERTEPFYNLTLEVKNNANVQTSLSKMIQDEILQGENSYYDDVLQKKVRAIKRLRIKRLPPILILQLKRFELNYDTFEKVKLNDKYVFPDILDMQPYMSESSTRSSSTLFKLSGILIHAGGANAGHYYSYIKDRNDSRDEKQHFVGSGISATGLNVNDNWLKFNDDDVDFFDTTNIPQECFGGFSRQFPIVKNAFILFYERCDQLQSQVKRGDAEGAAPIEPLKVTNAGAGNKRQKLTAVRADAILKPCAVQNESIAMNSGIPRDIRLELKANNEKFKKLARLHDEQYATFLCKAFKHIREDVGPNGSNVSQTSTLTLEVFQLCTYYVFNVLLYSSSKSIRNHDKSFLFFLCRTLEKSFTINTWFLKWFLSTEKEENTSGQCRLKVFLLQSPIPSSRHFVSRLVSTSIKSLVNSKEFEFMEDDFINCADGGYASLGLADGAWNENNGIDDDENDEDYVNDEPFDFNEDDDSSVNDQNEWSRKESGNESTQHQQSKSANVLEEMKVDNESVSSIRRGVTANDLQDDSASDYDSAPSSKSEENQDEVNASSDNYHDDTLHSFVDAITKDDDHKSVPKPLQKSPNKSQQKLRSLFGQFVSRWFYLLEESAIKYWRCFDEYFYCLFEILYAGIEDESRLRVMYNIVHSQYAVARMINIYLNEDSPRELCVLHECMKSIPLMEYKTRAANKLPILNLISLLSLVTRSTKFEKRFKAAHTVNTWGEPTPQYFQTIDQSVYQNYFMIRVGNVQVPYFSESFLSSSEFLEKLSEDTLELFPKFLKEPKQALAINLLFLVCVNSMKNSYIIMTSLLNILKLPFHFSDVNNSVQIMRMLLMMGSETDCEKVSSACTVRTDIFFFGKHHNQDSLVGVGTKAFIEHVANYFDLFESSNSFLEHLRTLQTTPAEAIHQNQQKSDYLKQLVLSCYDLLVELVLLDDKLNFADTLSKAFEFFKDRCNNRLQITTWDRLQADIKSLVDMSKAKK